MIIILILSFCLISIAGGIGGYMFYKKKSERNYYIKANDEKVVISSPIQEISNFKTKRIVLNIKEDDIKADETITISKIINDKRVEPLFIINIGDEFDKTFSLTDRLLLRTGPKLTEEMFKKMKENQL